MLLLKHKIMTRGQEKSSLLYLDNNTWAGILKSLYKHKIKIHRDKKTQVRFIYV